MSSLDIALTLVRGPGWLSAETPHLAPLLLILRPATNIDCQAEIKNALPEIETDLPEIETVLPEIETNLPETEILSFELENKYQPKEGHIFEL